MRTTSLIALAICGAALAGCANLASDWTYNGKGVRTADSDHMGSLMDGGASADAEAGSGSSNGNTSLSQTTHFMGSRGN